MRRSLIVATAVFATLLMGSTAALADSPHIIGSASTTVSGNSITFSASVAGLGNATTAVFDWNGTIDVNSRCYSKSGNKPQAANKQETINVAQTTTSNIDKNGRATASLTIAPLSTLTCPGGQRVVIESITYSITLSTGGDTLTTFSSS
jgi:hypothetical protein